MDLKVSKYYHLKRFKAILAICLVGLSILLSNLSLFEDLENKLLDLRFRQWNSGTKPDSNIVIVTIDDGSLDYFTQNGTSWPWPRSFYAYLVDYLNDAGAETIIFDMLFSQRDADRSETDAVETDGLFAESLKNYGNAALSMIINATEHETPDAIQATGKDHFIDQKYLLNDSLVELPIEELLKSCATIGHTNITSDRDGIYRHIRPFIKLAGESLPCLALAAYSQIEPDAKMTYAPGIMNIGDIEVPLEASGDVLVNWYGKAGAGGVFKYYPFSAVIYSASSEKYGQTPIYPLSTFKDKVVIVGTDASGMRDLKSTPVMNRGLNPGMEIWATLLSNFTQNHFITPVPVIVLLVLLFGMAFIILYAFDFLLARQAYPIFFGQLIVYVLLSYMLWSNTSRILLPITPGLILSALSYILVFSNEMRERIFLKHVFGAYVSPELMQHMRQTGETPSLGGEQITGTAFFSDIQGFTKYSEKLEPVKLVALLNEYLTVMTDTVMEHQGTLDKYVGDAIIAFYGAPVALENHAILAVKTALSMQTRLSELRLKWENEGNNWPAEIKDLQMRIGINSGEMLVGNVGSKGRMNFTMIGDTVNVAARLESSAKQYGVLNQISEATAIQLPDNIATRQLGFIRLVGKSQVATSYELLGYKADLSDQDLELLALWPKALEALENHSWQNGIQLFQKCAQLERVYLGRLTNPSKVYLETRIPYWQSQADGSDVEIVWNFASK